MAEARYHRKLQELVESVLESPGDSEPAMRKLVADRAARSGGRPSKAKSWAPTEKSPPTEMAQWTEKVALHAYRTTDEDVANLRAAGWTEDAIFELTVATALGAAVGRFERAMSVLNEARERRGPS
jgi:hypothetical protein